MHKTGTSAIQSFLSRKANKLLNESGILYVETGRDLSAESMHAGHHKLAWSTVKKYAEKKGANLSNEKWAKVLKEIENKSPNKAIISSEFFWPAVKKEMENVKSILNSYDTKIVIYVRNHLDMFISLYKQVLKGEKYSEGILNLLDSRKWILDYENIIRNWEKLFGSKNIYVRFFDKYQENIVRDFARVVGIEVSGGYGKKLNVSLPNGVMHLIRGLNIAERNLPPSCEGLLDRARRNIIAQRQPGKALSRVVGPLLPSAIMGPAERDRFREETEEMRARFLERYVAPEDYHIFDV